MSALDFTFLVALCFVIAFAALSVWCIELAEKLEREREERLKLTLRLEATEAVLSDIDGTVDRLNESIGELQKQTLPFPKSRGRELFRESLDA